MLTATQRLILQKGLRSNPIGAQIADILDVVEDAGTIPTASLVMSAQPTAADTVTIGGDVYEFQVAAADLADDANIAVEIGASAAETRDNLVAAINAAVGDEHPTIFQTDSTTPALGNGTEPVRADPDTTNLFITSTNAFAGNPSKPANPDILLAEAITAGADIWVEGNVNLNTLGGRLEGARLRTSGSLTITAAMLTLGTRFIILPFDPAYIAVEVKTSAGVVRVPAADTFVIFPNGIMINFGGGAAPDIQATDVLSYTAQE
jgi:hypothetical protein